MDLKEYTLHMHGIVKGEVSMADSKIGWRITFLGILISAFVALLIGFQDLMWWFIPFVIYFALKLTILINGLRPRLKYQKARRTKEGEIDVYSFIDIASIEFKDYVLIIKENFEGSIPQEEYILKQIHTNAVIAYTKYSMFKWSFPIWNSLVTSFKVALLIKSI